MPQVVVATDSESHLKPAAGIALITTRREILLLRHRHDDRWGTPGGGMQRGETPQQAACREVLEETGLTVPHPQLIDAFGGPEFEVTYPGGRTIHYVVVLYGATHWIGNISLQLDEVTDWGWLTQDQTGTIETPPDMQIMLPQAFAWYDQDNSSRAPVVRP